MDRYSMSAHILAGILAGGGGAHGRELQIARRAVVYADALLDALADENESDKNTLCSECEKQDGTFRKDIRRWRCDKCYTPLVGMPEKDLRECPLDDSGRPL